MDYRDEVTFLSEPEAEPPFPPAEFAARLARIRAGMAAVGIDTLLLTAPESMYYVSGYQCEWYQAQSPREWPASSCIAVRVDADRFIHFDTEREAVLGRVFSCSTDTRTFPRASMRDGTAFIVAELQAEGWLAGTVGIEEWSYRPNGPLQARLRTAFETAGARVVDGTDVVREARWVKSPAEVACLREAARIADVGLEAARATIAPGVTELDVYGEIVRAMARAGGENPGITMPVLSGSKTNAPHALSTRRVIGDGEVVTVDVSGVWKRYHVNQARTFHVGEPAADVAAVARTAAGAADAVRGVLRPDLPVRVLNETLLAYYRDTGLFECRGWIGGYEMGIAFPPDWVGNFVFDPLAERNADRTFTAGTCVNCETQVFLPRHVGFFFAIESILFEADTAGFLSRLPHDLQVIA
jgi:Xaa-Pro aminopeptidase